MIFYFYNNKVIIFKSLILHSYLFYVKQRIINKALKIKRREKIEINLDYKK
jgi:hypothetical protein